MLDRVWRKGKPPTLLVEMQTFTTIISVWKFLKKLKIQLPYYPEIPQVGIYPEKIIM